MSAQDCIKQVIDASNGRLGQEEVIEILDKLDAIRKEAINSPDKASITLAGIVEDEITTMKKAEYLETRNQIINLVKKNEILSYTNQFENKAEAIESLLVGTNRVVNSGRRSIETKKHALQSQYLVSGIWKDLKQSGLYDLVEKRTLSKEIAKELYELNLKEGTPGKSGSPEALKIAKIFKTYQDALIDRQNLAGAAIQDLNGFITRQTHSSEKINKAGYEVWRDDILEFLDLEKTFDEKTNKSGDYDEVLYDAYLGLISGSHTVSRADDNDLIKAFKGPSNLAKNISKHRKFHFQNADAWMEYNDLYGLGNFEEIFFKTIEKSATNIALMEELGPNPKAMLETIIDKLIQQNRDNPDTVKKLRNTKVDRYYNLLTGAVNIPTNPSIYTASQEIMALNSLSKLGGAVLSNFSDLGSQVAELTYQGAGAVESYFNAFKNLTRDYGKGADRKVAESIGIGIDGMMGSFYSRLGAENLGTGMLSNMARGFFKLNLLDWWTDAHRTGVSLMMSNLLAQNSDLSFSKIPPDLNRVLTLYGINNKDWELIRKTVYTAENGNRHITPDVIKNISTNAINKVFGSELIDATRYKNDLELKLREYFLDRVDFAVINPGIKELAQVRQDTKRGTLFGEALLHFWQFKSFPLAQYNKIVGPSGREVIGRGHENYKSLLLSKDILGFTGLIAQMTVLGYLSMSMKNLAKGLTPRDPKDPKTWAASFIQGGGAGLYGDFLFGEYDKYGRSFSKSLLGPTYSTIDDIFSITSKLKKGDDGVAAETFNLALNNTPYINLFYTRQALNYMVLYNIQEQLSPGYIQRMQDRMEQQTGQEYIVDPSNFIQ